MRWRQKMEDLKEIERRLSKIEMLVEGLKKDSNGYVDKEYCDLKMKSNAKYLEKLENEITRLTKMLDSIGEKITFFIQHSLTKDDVYRLIVIISIIFTIVNIIISIGLKK